VLAPLPKVAPNWKVELVAQSPQIRWPSVVECAPDGRIFVAEDSMDMPGPGNKPVDRVLCIHPDGRITVFAQHLYAVFGLKYIDGKLSSQACEGLLSVGAEILGVVVNDVSQDRLNEGFDVSYAHLGGYNNELGQGKTGLPDRIDRTRNQ